MKLWNCKNLLQNYLLLLMTWIGLFEHERLKPATISFEKGDEPWISVVTV